MKTLATFAFLLAALSSSAADAPATKDPIAWETTYSTAVKKAESESKPLLLKFYTGWCPFCTKMEKTTWQDASVAKAASSFACGKINADVEAPAVARYRTTGYPTIILATSTGEPIVKLEGYKDADTMTRVMGSFMKEKDSLGTAVETLKKDKKNVAAQLTVADFQAEAGLHEQAADTYTKASKVAQGDDLARASAGAGLALTRAGKADQAAKLLAKALATAGEAPSPALLLALGENEKALGHADKAKTYFDRLQSEHSGSPEAAAAKTALGG